MLALACLPTAGRKASVTLLQILAVDDDESIRALLSDYLGEQGYQVTAVGNGREMRKCLAEAPLDLVILDVKMPGEDGFALAQEIRQTSAIPIIMLTGEGHEVDRVLGLELGADDYLRNRSARANCWRASRRCCGATPIKNRWRQQNHCGVKPKSVSINLPVGNSRPAPGGSSHPKANG